MFTSFRVWKLRLMRSLVIKAKNKYENKRAKREDGGGKGVRILGRLEVIETHKRGIIAML